MRSQAHWVWVLVLGCLLGSSTTVRGEDNPPPSKQADLVDRLEELDRAMDDVIVEFYQQQVTREEAKQQLGQLMHSWLNGYLTLSKGRRTDVLGKLELDFLNRITRDRDPFIERYSTYLLGDKEAVNQGELLLLERLIESIELYVSPYLEAPTPAAPPSPGAEIEITPRVQGKSP